MRIPPDVEGMGEEIVGDGRAEGARMPDGTVRVDHVPMDDRGEAKPASGGVATLSTRRAWPSLLARQAGASPTRERPSVYPPGVADPLIPPIGRIPATRSRV